MIPMGGDLFMIEEMPSLRIRFLKAEGAASALSLLRDNGETTEVSRNP